MTAVNPDRRAQDREIVRLAGPAFLALVAEPLFLLADAAIVGHLGTPQLAGLGIAGAVVQTAVGLCVFLAYGTTASVARRIGAGDARGALQQGVDGMWLAVLIGGITTLLGFVLADGLVGLFGPSAAVHAQATTYLRWAFFGVIPLLVMLAATGVLRGLQDTRTPLLVAVIGNLANIGLNYGLVYGLHLVPAPTRVLVFMSHSLKMLLPFLIVMMIVGLVVWKKVKHKEQVRNVARALPSAVTIQNSPSGSRTTH